MRAASSVVLTLLVAASSNLRPVLDAGKSDLERETGEKISIQYGASGSLARQIENGAPFDLFLAADRNTPEALVRQGLLDPGSLVCYATGSLVLVVASDAGLNPPDRIERSTAKALLSLPFRRLAMASPKLAPYGRAAEETLRALHAGPGVWDRLVYAENVEEVLAYVKSGNAELGFVSRSLVTGVGLKVIAVDPSLHTPLEQFAAIPSASRHKEAARRLLAALTSPRAKSLWGRFGYMTASASPTPSLP